MTPTPDEALATVLRVLDQRGADAYTKFVTVLTAYAESDFNVGAEQFGSRGIFQQTLPWWTNDRMDVASATNAFLDDFMKKKHTNDPVVDAWNTQHWLAPDPSKDLKGFKEAPETINYTRRLDKIDRIIQTGRVSATSVNYPYSAYGVNPNSGRNANAENGWGPWKWPQGVPAGMLGTAAYGNVKLDVRKEIVNLTTILMRITEDKYHYNLYGPNEKPPAGWCWGYSNRPIAGTSTASNHSKGRAVDLNAPNNPYTSPLVCDIPPVIVNTWEKAGFYWGGRYNGSKDAMHFEYCWTPNDVPRHVAYAAAILGGEVPPIPEPDPKPPLPEDDDMARRIVTVYDGTMKPIAQAYDGPNGCIVLANEEEFACVNAVIDNDTMVNQRQIDVYNSVLRRGVL